MPSRGMYWGDFRALLLRNQATNAQITFYQDPKINKNKVAVLDRKLPRRNPDVLYATGYSEEDHYRDSHICEVTYVDGMIPMESSKGQWDEQASKFVEQPQVGALKAIETLIREGSLDRRSDELRGLFREHGRRWPPVS